MEQADKFSYATTSGICTIFASCVGGHIYHDSNKSGIYSEDKHICGYDADTLIVFSSALTGLVLMLVVYIGLTAFECYKVSKKSNSSFGKTFIVNIFSKESIISVILMFALGLGLAFLGLLFIGLAFFLLPLLKGKFKWIVESTLKSGSSFGST